MKTAYTSAFAEETEAIAEQFAKELQGGECVGLTGPLGVGKTCFMRGVVRGLSVLKDVAVCSPSFTLVNEYPLRSGGVLFHIDLYRLHSWRDFIEIDGLALLAAKPQCLTFVEWADRFPELLPHLDWRIDIGEQRDETRTLSIVRLKSGEGPDRACPT